MSSQPANLEENNGAALTITAATFLALTYVSVALRVYVRRWLTKSFLADDWLMLLSQANFTVSCTFILIGIPFGIGRHNKALSQRQEIEALKWQALATASYVSNMLFIKLSIAVFLLRLSGEKKYKYAIWASAAIVLVWSVVLFFWNIFQCSPVEAQWDYTIPGLKCVTSDQVVSAALALSAMTVLSDFFYALLPVPIIWRVKMTKQAKLTVMLILGLGVFASIATLIRLKFLADLNDTADILFAGTDAMVWTLIEPGVAIMATSLATIRPLLRKLRLPGFGSTGVTGRSGPTGGGGGYGPGRSGKSAALRSATNRSAATRGSSAMPGFGAADMPLEDLESARGGGGGSGGGSGVVVAAAATTTSSSSTTTAGKGVLVTKTTTVVTSIPSPAAPPPPPQQQQQQQQQHQRRSVGGVGGGWEARSGSDSDSTRGLATNPAASPTSETFMPGVEEYGGGGCLHGRSNSAAQQQQQQQQSQSQSRRPWDGAARQEAPQIPKIDVDFRHGSWPSPIGSEGGGGGGRSDAARRSSQFGVQHQP
ncbi:hypothetical protein RB594_008301 [Gaeumannomyces avenae]